MYKESSVSDIMIIIIMIMDHVGMELFFIRNELTAPCKSTCNYSV